MVLAIEHSFFAAFNPFLIFNVIRNIGAPYFLLTFLLLMLLSASSTLMNMLYGSISYNVFVAISSFVGMFFTLIMFHLVGYTLYQYHDELGYVIEVDVDDLTDKESNEAVKNPELRTVEILIQEGKMQDAQIKLTHLIKERPADHDAQMHNLQLQKLLGDMESYDKYAKKYISYLISAQQITIAAKILPTILSSNPSFKPTKANERFELAKQLNQNGHSQAAIKLITNLHIDFPDFNQIPEAYLMVSKILCERLGNDKQAKNILTFLLQKYPRSDQQENIKNYLKIVDSLS